MKMNLPNKITMARIILSILMLILLVFPFYQVGFKFPVYSIADTIKIDLKYIIGGIMFLVASITDFVDGNIARKRNLVTDFGKVMDAIADKVLVNGTLIVLATNNFIPAIIPVVIVTRDIFVDSIKMVAGNKGNVVAASWMGKVKTICMMSGVTLTFFYNLPFELININISDFLLLIATVLSIVSGVQYFQANKKFLLADK